MSPGQVIGSIYATDADGSAPGNVVKYSLVNSDSDLALKYFAIGEDSGEITVTDDLTKEIFDEYRLDIQAYDLGTPALSTIITVLVRVRQVITQPPDAGIGFVSTEQTVNVNENVPEDTVITTLALDKKDKTGLRMECKIISAKDASGKSLRDCFKGKLNDNQDCELVQGSKPLDHELFDQVTVEMKLLTLSAYTNPNKIKATITVYVMDENDNPPKFIYDQDLNNLVADQYLVAIPDSIPANQEIFQIQVRGKV